LRNTRDCGNSSRGAPVGPSELTARAPL